jgi:hypothetical protein
VLGRQAIVVVDLHVDVASVEWAADDRNGDTLHTVIFAAPPAQRRLALLLCHLQDGRK